MPNDKILDSNITAEKQRLKDTINGRDLDDIGVLGYGVMYTVGADWNCIVPRDWLMDRVRDLGIPDHLAPSEPRPHYAYDRAMKWMREDWLEPYEIVAPRMDNDVKEPHKVEVNLRQGDSKRIWHVYAEVFFDEQESKQEGGTWVQHDLGYFSYDSTHNILRSHKDDGLSADHHLYEVWQDVSEGGMECFERMEECHIAQDIRKMMYDTVNKYTTNVIKLRRSVYLFPAGMGDFVDRMAQLYSEVNDNWKIRGEPVAVRSFEVLDTDDKRDWIQQQVIESLRDNLDDVLDAAFESFDEGEAADRVVAAIRENMSASIETAELYNTLLEAEIDIEEVLAEQKASVSDSDKEDIIDRVVAQTDIDEF